MSTATDAPSNALEALADAIDKHRPPNNGIAGLMHFRGHCEEGCTANVMLLLAMHGYKIVRFDPKP